MLISTWVDTYGSVNILPRMAMILLWNFTVLTMYFFIYWFFWVWFQALIAGSSFDNPSFAKKARIIGSLPYLLTFLTEIVRFLF